MSTNGESVKPIPIGTNVRRFQQADVIAHYERLSPKFSGWLPAAMKPHAGRLCRNG